MEAVGPVFETVKCLSVPLLRQIGYVKNLKKNFEKLKTEARYLYALRDGKVNTARPGKVPSSLFEVWVKDVDEIKNKINAIEVEFMEEKGWAPNISWRMKIGKRIMNLINIISDLKERIKPDTEVMVDEPPPGVEVLPGPRIESGTSAGRTLQKVMECITNAGILKIGIYGMGGVGKTTLMKNLNNQSDIAQMFEYVIWVTVSQTWSIRKVQNEVAQRLSLNLTDDMSDDVVSRRLCHILKNTKYLLLLDDVWDKVGIPTPNEVNGCKIVLTTRSQHVCNKMETDKEITVEVMHEEEAWELFCERVGSAIDSLTINPLARRVVRECGGLPLAIIVVGSALREEENVHVWKYALKQLSSAATSHIEGMEDEVFKPLKYSYDRLKGDRQTCFLYGALYPEDHKIVVEELIEYWRAAGLIDGVERLSDALDGGHAILKDLVDASLLEKCEGVDETEEYVKMHDVIRDLALRITFVKGEGNNKFLVRAGKGIEDPPGEEEWKECNIVSLMNNELRWLPEQAVCPILSTLLLQNNFNLGAIPESFFESMHALQVLDLSCTLIKSLPPSICNLVSLRGIYLDNCGLLDELPSEIGALKGLEVLRIGGNHNSINDLPIEVGELTRLKCLRVMFSSRGSELPNKPMIPHGIISRLSLLEDLSIHVYNSDGRWDMNLEDVMEEVGNLKKLSNLEFWFTRVEFLECFIDKSVPWKNGILSSFQFIVGPRNRFPIYYFLKKAGRSLNFNDGNNIPDVIRQVLYRADRFNLCYHRSIKKLEEFGLENMTQLRYIKVSSCFEMESLMDRDCSVLEELKIAYIPNLRNIWDEDQGRAPVTLRVLQLSGCDGLQKVLLPQSFIQHLPNLQVIEVENCTGIREMIEGDGGGYNALPKLKILTLWYLPNLESICTKVLAWSSIQQITISGCNKLKRLPFGIHNTSTLKRIHCKEARWWESLHWEDDETKTKLQPFVSCYKSPI